MFLGLLQPLRLILVVLFGSKYNKFMARGWESKAVEAQVEDASERGSSSKKHLTLHEIEVTRKRESLLLSRTRILQELHQSRNPRYQKILTAALADLDEKLAQLN